MILLGTPIDAARAHELGLVNEIVPQADLRAHALGKAAELARQPPNALRLSRALLRGSLDEVNARIEEEAQRPVRHSRPSWSAALPTSATSR